MNLKRGNLAVSFREFIEVPMQTTQSLSILPLLTLLGAFQKTLNKTFINRNWFRTLGDSVKRSLSYQSFQFWNVKRFSSWKKCISKKRVREHSNVFVCVHTVHTWKHTAKGTWKWPHFGPKNFTSFNLGISFFPASFCQRCTTGMGTRLARWLRESSAGRRLVHYCDLIHRNDLLQFKEASFGKCLKVFSDMPRVFENSPQITGVLYISSGCLGFLPSIVALHTLR